MKRFQQAFLPTVANSNILSVTRHVNVNRNLNRQIVNRSYVYLYSTHGQRHHILTELNWLIM